jgi:short-subunit dehydrogenase
MILVVLTGATHGIGLATARLLVPRVRHLVLHGPQPDKEDRG